MYTNSFAINVSLINTIRTIRQETKIMQYVNVLYKLLCNKRIFNQLNPYNNNNARKVIRNKSFV